MDPVRPQRGGDRPGPLLTVPRLPHHRLLRTYSILQPPRRQPRLFRKLLFRLAKHQTSKFSLSVTVTISLLLWYCLLGYGHSQSSRVFARLETFLSICKIKNLVVANLLMCNFLFGLSYRLYIITQWSCNASWSLWEMPDSNPGPLATEVSCATIETLFAKSWIFELVQKESQKNRLGVILFPILSMSSRTKQWRCGTSVRTSRSSFSRGTSSWVSYR